MSARRRRLAASSVAAVGMAVGGLAWVPGAAGVAAAAGTTLYVSPTGAAANTDADCSTAGYNKISTAVAAAVTGDTIEVCPGTYDDSVSLNSKAVTIDGGNGGAAILDAVNQTIGIVVAGPATAGTTIKNLTVENAKRAGVYLGGTSNITLSTDTITGNDQSCQPQVTEDDCGESVEIEGLTNSLIDGNTITKGTGGILVSDGIPAGSTGQQAFGATTPTSGPTTGNVISNNTITNNVWDCGITMAAHNSNAITKAGPAPAVAGVFGNTVKNNVVTGNGTSGGGGSGIILATPFPGAGSYNNTIQGNHVDGNGQGGIVLHSHAPGQDVNGNQILDNILGTNAVGETDPGVGVYTTGASVGDPDAGDPATTAIEVASAVVPITGTVIDGNQITGDHYGVLLENAVANVTHATDTKVDVPVYNVPAPDSGYALVGTDGAVYHEGNSPSWGSAKGVTSGAPVVGIAQTPIDGGYWEATDTGGVFSYGDAAFFGSLGGVKLVQPVVGIASTPDGHGYWMVAKDGGVFAFGDAGFFGSLGGVKLTQPVVGIASTSDGQGYWLVASDGGIFAFGDAHFKGSTGGVKLNKPVVGMSPSTDDGGYWLTASDGGVFAFGDAKFKGSTGGVKLVQPVVGIASTSTDGGYWLVAADGGIFNYGDAHFHGSASGKTSSPVSGIYSS